MARHPRPGWVLAERRAIGHRIARYRQARGWSLDDLAGAAEVARTSVVSAEQGTHATTLDVLLQLAAALGVTVGQLLEADPPQR
jgi:transcriptional regulator with XRE-family HTH domain